MPCKKRKRRTRRKHQHVFSEAYDLMRLGITATATLGIYGTTMDALSKMKR